MARFSKACVKLPQPSPAECQLKRSSFVFVPFIIHVLISLRSISSRGIHKCGSSAFEWPKNAEGTVGGRTNEPEQ